MDKGGYLDWFFGNDMTAEKYTERSVFTPMIRAAQEQNTFTGRKLRFAEFLIIPTERIKNRPLPAPFAHVYYNSRVRDIESNVRKVGGHLLSQLYILARVLKSLFFR